MRATIGELHARADDEGPPLWLRLLVGGEVWPQVTVACNGRGQRRAAIAYLGADAPRLLQLRRYDVLVVNASDAALLAHATSPKALEADLAAGVRVSSSAKLHAKVLVTPTHAVIGSANASTHSSAVDEAVVISDRQGHRERGSGVHRLPGDRARRRPVPQGRPGDLGPWSLGAPARCRLSAVQILVSSRVRRSGPTWPPTRTGTSRVPGRPRCSGMPGRGLDGFLAPQRRTTGLLRCSAESHPSARPTSSCRSSRRMEGDGCGRRLWWSRRPCPSRALERSTSSGGVSTSSRARPTRSSRACAAPDSGAARRGPLAAGAGAAGQAPGRVGPRADELTDCRRRPLLAGLRAGAPPGQGLCVDHRLA